MDRKAMKQSIMEALSRKLGDGYHVSFRQVLKTNQKLDGLTILRDGSCISPSIYLDPFYVDLENGISLDDVINEILRVYSSIKMYPNHFDTDAVKNFSYAKSRLYVELINRHLNMELLQNIPHSMFLDDFAVTVRCLVGTQGEESASFLVHNSLLDMWHVEKDALLSLAIQNTRELLGIDLRNMGEVIAELCPSPRAGRTADMPMWVMTNKQKLSGASTVLFSDILEDFAEKHGNFYVIFSSVHEALLVPTPDSSDIDTITQINQQVNAAQVQEGEILGTKAYYYSKDKGFIL